MFLPYGSFGAMMNFMRAMMLLCCALAFSAHAEIPVSNSFDHVRTGYMLRDVHASLMCEQCHVDGIFKNTPRDCAGCHTLGSRVGATPKPINHVQSNKPCDVCHTSPTSFQVKNFSHAGFATNCASCHNGQSSGVTSKPSNHFPTVLACETCHLNTATFTSTRMNHAGIASNCAQCHGGQFPAVVGKTATHIVTTGACESCHNASNTGNFSTFQGARYGHNAVAAGSCATCHNGGTAIGKTASHIATTAACDVCHTVSNTNNYASFQGAQFNHSTATPAVTGICSTCHSGATATGKPTFHITTTAQCDSSGCHTSSTTQNFTTFVGATFTHSTATPAVASRCSTCHGGQSPSVQSKNATHIPTTAQCDVCHTAGNTANYTSFQGASFAHSTATPSVANRCSTCHGGQSADVTSKHATHIATTVECDVCHTASNTANYSSFQGATFAHSTATPAVANRCSACHGGQSADVVSKPASHFATTAQCDVCHTASNTANYTSFQGASFAHSTATPAVANRCSACHGGQSADVVSKP
ncbi:MAG: hypothetical protein KJ899_08250, partial [Gammaproteobacteria bacterium]|nr:hypothetical protein [Gammaproteobacteria bacterium]